MRCLHRIMDFSRSAARNREGFRTSIIAVLSSFLLILLVGSGYSQTDVSRTKTAYISRFGQRELRDAEVVAEIRVDRIYHLGMGVDVVKVNVEKEIMNRLPREWRGRKSYLVLAHRGQFIKGTRLSLLMKRYGASDRMAVIDRLSRVDKNYKDKVRLIQAYVRVENIPNARARLKALVEMVMKNLKDESQWVQRNGLYELEGLIEEKKWPFTTGDVAYLQKIEEEAENRDFMENMAEVREKMASQANEGPCVLEKSKEGEGEKENGR